MSFCLRIALVSLLALIFVFLLIRNEVAFRNRRKIGDAIFLYQIQCVTMDEPILVDYDDIEHYDHTMFRFWDFGCSHILPKEKFELIEPYLGIKTE